MCRPPASLNSATTTFLGEQTGNTPFVIGVAGSVAVGKSTTARILREMLARWPDTPRVELVMTDGFLYSNAELSARGSFGRKGFPESYDQRAVEFCASSEVGCACSFGTALRPPHLRCPSERKVVRRPSDVLIVEGLNVLQPAKLTKGGTGALAVSDFFDFSIYVDANHQDVRSWYLDRFLSLRRTAFQDPNSYFHRFAHLNDDESLVTALGFWDSINLPNLVENIAPTLVPRDPSSAQGREPPRHKDSVAPVLVVGRVRRA